MIGAFCFEGTWKGWSPDRLAGELASLRALGVTVILTETIEPPIDLIRAAEDAGLRTFVSVPCFSAHGWPELIEGLDVHPVGADGQPRTAMEWYTGLIPTHAGYDRGLMRRIRRVARARPAALVLDFIRWPLHWELELRAGAPAPQEASFDRRTLRAFAAWQRERGLTEEGRLDAGVLTGRLRDRWTVFKCEVITRFACAAADAVRSIDPAIAVGAFIVPGTDDQRRQLLGQDVRALGACLDLVAPMAYHGILHEPVDFVGWITTDVRERSAARVVPVVQVTAEPAVAGPWDWGTGVSPAEFGRAVEEALRVAQGAILFPLEGMDAARRTVLADILDARPEVGRGQGSAVREARSGSPSTRARSRPPSRGRPRSDRGTRRWGRT